MKFLGYTKLSQVASTVLGRCDLCLIHQRCPFCSCYRKANAIGRSSKTVREFLEKNHKDDMTRDESIKLTVKSLLEVVQTGAKNIEISVMEEYGKVTVSGDRAASPYPTLHLTSEPGPCANRSYCSRN